MAKYELWKKEVLTGQYNPFGSNNGKPEEDYYTPDLAMDAAKRLSKGTHKQHYYDEKAWTSKEIDTPNIIVMVERDAQSVIRGFGIGGKWHDARDCKRCNNTGDDVNTWGIPCSACSGSGWKIKL